jgi:hypothetical protein
VKKSTLTKVFYLIIEILKVTELIVIDEDANDSNETNEG